MSHSRFSIFHHFLRIPGRIPPELIFYGSQPLNCGGGRILPGLAIKLQIIEKLDWMLVYSFAYFPIYSGFMYYTLPRFMIFTRGWNLPFMY